MMNEDLLLEVVQKVEEIGIKPRSLSCDMGNQQVFIPYCDFCLFSSSLLSNFKSISNYSKFASRAVGF